MKRLLIILGLFVLSLSAFGQRWTQYYSTFYKDSITQDSTVFVFQTLVSQGSVLFTTLDSIWRIDPVIDGTITIGSATVDETELEILDGASWTTAEGNDILAGNTLEDVIADDATDIASSKAVYDYAAAAADSLDANLELWLIRDTIVLAAFGGIDTFSTSIIYGSFYNNGSDSLLVTEMAVSCLGTTVSFTVDIEWHATLNSGSATGLNDTPPTITDESGAIVSDTSFDNAVIPPGVQVWLKTPTVGTAPTYLFVTLLGKRQNASY